MSYIIAFSVFLIIIGVLYYNIGIDNIKVCYQLWFRSEYWTNYNIVEAISWVAKAIIIIPGLLFGLQIWWLYVFSLTTSVLLIWASNKKLLPTLVAFNTLWVLMSSIVIVNHFIG